MPLPLIAIAKGLAAVAPSIAGWFGGDDAEKNAQAVVDVATTVTGLREPQDALAAIRADPELRIEFAEAMQPVIISRLENETKQQAEVNATMRAEYSSGNKFKSSWRPLFGYIVGVTWLLQTIGIFWLAYIALDKTGSVGTAVNDIANLIGALMPIWAVALTVLGVNVSKRSQDKQVAAGQSPIPGLIGSLMQRVGRSG